jgi:hypothetical protein
MARKKKKHVGDEIEDPRDQDQNDETTGGDEPGETGVDGVEPSDDSIEYEIECIKKDLDYAKTLFDQERNKNCKLVLKETMRRIQELIRDIA